MFLKKLNKNLSKQIQLFISGCLVFANRDLKTRYAGSMLGSFWIVAYPLALATVVSLAFSFVFRSVVNNVPFFLYSLSGFCVWIYVLQSVSSTCRSLINNRELIVNNKIKTEMIIIGLLISRSVDLMVTSVFLFFAAFYLNVLHFSLVGFIGSVVALFLFVTILSLIASSINVYFRDTQALTDIFLNLLFYLTPVFYTIDIIPARFVSIVLNNPLTFIVTIFRSSFFQIMGSSQNLFLFIVLEALLLIASHFFYLRLEKGFGQHL